MGCFVVAEFLLTSATRGPSAIAESLVQIIEMKLFKSSVSSCERMVAFETFGMKGAALLFYESGSGLSL